MSIDLEIQRGKTVWGHPLQPLRPPRTAWHAIHCFNNVPLDILKSDLFAFFVTLSYVESSWNIFCETPTGKEGVSALGLNQILTTEISKDKAFHPYDNTLEALREFHFILKKVHQRSVHYNCDLKVWQALFIAALVYNGGGSYYSKGTFEKCLKGIQSSYKKEELPDCPPAYAALLLFPWEENLLSSDQLKPPQNKTNNEWRQEMVQMAQRVIPVWTSTFKTPPKEVPDLGRLWQPHFQ